MTADQDAPRDRSFVMGVDLGSNTAKSVVLDDRGRLVAHSVVKMGAVSKGGVRASIEQTLDQAGLTRDDLSRIISTGYGRKMVEGAHRSLTEITCHARGASVLAPGVRMVIDVGGQDSKAIAVDEGGFVEQFTMNDRCAGGTGKFFEVLAGALEVPIEEIGDLALEGSDHLEISSMCATFGETEVISMLAADQAKPDILAAVHAAVAKRTVGLVTRVGLRTPVVMTGGVAKNPGAVRYIADALGVDIHLPDNPQIAGAFGAALIALDDVRGATGHDHVSADADLRDREIARRLDPSCDRCGPAPGEGIVMVSLGDGRGGTVVSPTHAHDGEGLELTGAQRRRLRGTVTSCG